MIHITIPLNPVTKKNSMRIARAGGHYKLLPSKAFEEYQKSAGYFLGKWRDRKISVPIEVRCLFYRKSRHRVDLTNLLNAIDDILVHYGVLADDNCNIIVSHDGSRVLYDKANPRTEVYITALPEGKEKDNDKF